MPDFLDILAKDAIETVASCYYSAAQNSSAKLSSLVEAIKECKKAPVIAEVKTASPSAGIIRNRVEPGQIAQAMKRGGAVGISVLTEPKHFFGTLDNLREIRRSVGLPILMKDIVVSPLQLDAASNLGANAVLLIQALFDRGYGELSLSEMIAEAHSRHLEVLLETHNIKEFEAASKGEADLVGINNRDLATLEINLKVTQTVLRQGANAKPVVSESGISNPADLRFLRDCGAKVFLIGSAVMRADDIEAKVKEFVDA